MHTNPDLMDNAQKVNCLKSVEFIKSLPPEKIRHLASDCGEIIVPADNVIFRDEDPGESMFIVLTGAVELIKNNQVIATLGPGEFIGETALIQSEPRSATAKSVSRCHLLEIDREQFLRHLGCDSKALFAFMRSLTKRNMNALHDMKQRLRLLQNQEKLNQTFHRILEDSSEEIYIVDSLSFSFLQTNSRACRNLGYSLNELKNRTLLDVVPDLSPDEIHRITDLLINEIKTVEVVQGSCRRKDGSTYPMEIRLQLMKSGCVPLLVARVKDLTERQEMESKIKDITFLDPLTGLPNRKLFLERLELALAESKDSDEEIRVLFLDLDNFKTVNDSLSRETGDALLQEVSKLLKRSIGKDDLVARAGEDEFLIMLRGLTLEDDAALVAQNLVDDFKTPVLVGGQEINTSVSIGISNYPAPGKTGQELLMQAETALYSAKEKGKNTYLHFSPSILSQATKYMDIERGLIKALEREELELYYQPSVNLETGAIVGVEALLQWRHPEKGMMPPGEFISVAEKSKLILPIGEWVLKTACRQFKSWEEMGVSPDYVAVNYSGIQFKEKDSVAEISSILQETNLDPQHLELEITESILMENTSAAISTLFELSELGIQLAIDDFGTGFSSLTYLAQLPVDTLKIDRSFVIYLPETTSSAIASTIVSLGKVLGMKVVAEGVETGAQKEFLRSIRCDCMQGFLYSKPLSAKEITKLLQEKNPAAPVAVESPQPIAS